MIVNFFELPQPPVTVNDEDTVNFAPELMVIVSEFDPLSERSFDRVTLFAITTLFERLVVPGAVPPD
jgi:hypothetical protein